MYHHARVFELLYRPDIGTHIMYVYGPKHKIYRFDTTSTEQFMEWLVLTQRKYLTEFTRVYYNSQTLYTFSVIDRIK